MIKRHCFVTQIGDAIEKLADALDPERKPPFRGDILDLLEWAEKDVLAMRSEIEKARAEVAHVKEVEFPRKVAVVAENWRKKLDAKDVEIERLKTVPMRYRRMAFNAQLQDENAQLRQQLAKAQTQSSRRLEPRLTDKDVKDIVEICDDVFRQEK